MAFESTARQIERGAAAQAPRVPLILGDVSPVLSRCGWWFLMLTSVGLAIWSWRFLVVQPELLYPLSPDGIRLGGDAHFFGLLEERWLRFAGHFVFAPLALLVGPFQFVERLRRSRPRVHRALGWVYVGCIAVAGVASLLLAPGSYGGLVTHFGFGMLGGLWLLTTGLALWHARHRRWVQHRDWMVRSFALTYGAVTLRLWIGVFMAQGHDFESTYQTVAWLSWVPNLLIAEWLCWAALQRRRVAVAAS